MVETKKDFERAEGVYAKVTPYVGVPLLTVERVCGDCTVRELGMTPDEARSLVRQLTKLGYGA